MSVEIGQVYEVIDNIYDVVMMTGLCLTIQPGTKFVVWGKEEVYNWHRIWIDGQLASIHNYRIKVTCKLIE